MFGCFCCFFFSFFHWLFVVPGSFAIISLHYCLVSIMPLSERFHRLVKLGQVHNAFRDRTFIFLARTILICFIICFHFTVSRTLLVLSSLILLSFFSLFFFWIFNDPILYRQHISLAYKKAIFLACVCVCINIYMFVSLNDSYSIVLVRIFSSVYLILALHDIPIKSSAQYTAKEHLLALQKPQNDNRTHQWNG